MDGQDAWFRQPWRLLLLRCSVSRYGVRPFRFDMLLPEALRSVENPCNVRVHCRFPAHIPLVCIQHAKRLPLLDLHAALRAVLSGNLPHTRKGSALPALRGIVYPRSNAVHAYQNHWHLRDNTELCIPGTVRTRSTSRLRNSARHSNGDLLACHTQHYLPVTRCCCLEWFWRLGSWLGNDWRSTPAEHFSCRRAP